MRSDGIVLLLALAALPARADTRLVTAVVLVEPGLAAPVLSLRNIAANGNAWEAAVSGWTVSVGAERPLDRGVRLIGAIAATPYNAGSSLRMYTNGTRARDLEYDAGSYSVRGGLRLRHGERSTSEIELLIGREVIGSGAPSEVRRDWDSAYAGVIGSRRYRRVTADDPFSGRMDGFEVAARVEAYGANRFWSRLTVSQTAGRSFGRTHVQQTALIVAGTNLDRVSSFLAGGSWDALGPQAIYGRRYAEYRVTRGVGANAAADRDLSETWTIGSRLSAFRAPGITTYGSAVQTAIRVRGFRLTVGAAVPFGGTGEHPRMLYAALSTAAFR